MRLIDLKVIEISQLRVLVAHVQNVTGPLKIPIRKPQIADPLKALIRKPTNTDRPKKKPPTRQEFESLST